ncbi:MAG: hypothetical protein LBR47_04410, partial [Spirochaetaceae bacterium]|nr:hypothetical protein [Spirochaetaceae bacterium]
FFPGFPCVTLCRRYSPVSPGGKIPAQGYLKARTSPLPLVFLWKTGKLSDADRFTGKTGTELDKKCSRPDTPLCLPPLF